MSTILHTCLTRFETAKLSIHDIRLASAVYSPDTGRFHPDEREHAHMSQNGKMLTNLFQLGTASVVSQDGTVYDSVTARNGTRAAAAVAIRYVRSHGKTVQHWDVSMRNKSGESHDETVFFGTDCGATQDETVGDERADIVVELTQNEIDCLCSGHYDDDDMDGWQDSNWDGHLSQIETLV